MVSITWSNWVPWHIRIGSYLGDVLALKLGEESLQAVIVSLNTDGGEDVLNVLGRRRVVASEAEEEVSGEVLHFECGDCYRKLVRL